MAISADCLLLLLLLVQPRVEAGADKEAVVCSETACYTAHWGKLTADQAQGRCSQNGGNLASVKNEEEAQHIQQALGQLLKSEASLGIRIGKFWIGLQRAKGKCLDPDLPLKGFSWLGGGEDTQYTNWHKELRNSCISKRCVSLLLDLSLPPQASRLPKWSEGPCGSPGSPGSSIEGFVCKFSFKGMCRPLALGGPGQVNYTTPFQTTSSSLEAVPFASVANVACGTEGEGALHYFVCREKEPNVFNWGNSGPLCVSSKYGCNFNNGGCQQDCFEGGDGSFRCGCRPGFRLLDDLVTCASRNPCSSKPCRGNATCHPEPNGKSFTCLCPEGYQLDWSQRECVDVDECQYQSSSCSQGCINTPGSYHCHCWIGYKPVDFDQVTCEDVDECATNSSLCAQGCVNTEGSFFCTCQKGYILDKDSNQCVDVDECANPETTKICDSLCFNTPGSFHCGCDPGWELASDGISCTMKPVSPRLLSEPSQRDMGGGEGSSVPSVTMSTSTRDPDLISKVAPSTMKPSHPPRVHITSAAPETWASTVLLDEWRETDMQYPSVTTGHKESEGGDVAKHLDEEGTDGQKLLLFYILGTVIAILLLLALALGLLIYRKRRTRKAEIKEKSQSVTEGSRTS